MVSKKIYWMFGLILVLFLSFSFLANAEDQYPDFPCTTNEECQLVYDLGEYGSCDLTLGYCVLLDELPFSNQTDLTNIANTTNVSVAATIPTLDQQQLVNLEAKLAQLEALSLQIQNQVNQLSTKDQQVNSQVETLNSNLQEITFQQNQIKDEISKKITTVSVGLASVQIDLNATQTKLSTVEETVLARESFNRILTYIIFVLVALGVAVGVIYYLQRKKGSSKELDSKTKSYITQMIKRGLKFPTIKQNLAKAGWAEEEINWAYKETLKQNYSQYVQKRGSSFVASLENKSPSRRSSKDVTKIISLVVVSLLLVVGVILLMRGISTGQAIYFQNSDELSTAVKDDLDKNIESNIFYSKVVFTNLCLQVEDKEKSASYQIIKTPYGHTIRVAELPCDQDNTYDFSVKFLSWESFDYLINGLDCKKLSQANNLEKIVVVLPSKYILKGFKLNPEEDATKFCGALKQCMGDSEVKAMGLNC